MGEGEAKRVVGVGTLIALLFKLAACLLMVATPLFGVWLASSLAAYQNGEPRWALLAGLLLFPILPLAWEGFAAVRKRGRPRALKVFDRLVLRTLFINLLFIGGMVGTRPKLTYVALSARGDWMLQNRNDAFSQQLRPKLFWLASRLELLSQEQNRYRKPERKDDKPHPKPAPVATEKSVPVLKKWPHWPEEERLHPLVSSMPAEVETSPEAVAKYIAEREKDPFGRWKAIHDYVVDRIAYDVPVLAMEHVPLEDADADTVFRNRKGVCAGYADLMRKMGESIGETVFYVTGHSRSQRNSSLDGVGHAWNIVKVGDSWFQIDATWDAGVVGDGKFEKRYSTAYLFAPPEVFGLDHFPEEEWAQLRYPALDRGEFMRLPMLRPEFFSADLELINPNRSQVTVPSALDLELKNPKGRRLWLRYAQKGSDDDLECGRPVSGGSFHCQLPGDGAYDVRLYLEGDRGGLFHYIGQVEVNVHS